MPEPTPTPETTEEVNPYVAHIAKTFDLVLDAEAEAKPPEPPAPPSKLAGLNLGEKLEIRDEKEAAKTPEQKAAEAATGEKKDETPPAEVKADTAPAKPAIVLKKIEEPVPALPASVEPEKTEPTAAQLEEEKFINSLTEDERDELALAKFAEANGKTGMFAQTLDYFKKDKAVLAEHEDWNGDNEEYLDWLKANKPKWGSERRRMEKALLIQQATQAATVKAAEQFEPQARKLREMEAAPVIDRALVAASKLLTEPSGQPDMEPIPSEVLQAINEKGYTEALKEFPDEAPLVQGTVNATQAYLRVRMGVEQFDPAKNPTHQWLNQFIANESANMLKQPKEVQIQNGRQFMPLAQYEALARSNPAEAVKYWTFPDDMVVEMIAANSVIHHNQKLQSLKKRGWTREKVSPAAETKTPAAAPSSDGPRATTGRLQGGALIEKGTAQPLPAHLQPFAGV